MSDTRNGSVSDTGNASGSVSDTGHASVTRRLASALGRLLLVLSLTAAAGAQEPRLQDPMRPPAPAQSQGAGGSAAAGLALTGVLVSETRRIALINGRIYREGDRINGEEIVAIEQGSILIRRGGTDVRVRVRNYDAVTTRNDGDEGQ